LGSKSQPSPAGKPSTALESIGGTGALNGRLTGQS
jgi:hypothetical protein